MSLTDLGAWALRQLDPETAHRLAIRALQMTPLPAPGADDPILKATIAGLEMSNPVGLAAGLDKNGEALEGLSRLGFGAVECGSVTPRAQPGNPKPRQTGGVRPARPSAPTWAPTRTPKTRPPTMSQG